MRHNQHQTEKMQQHHAVEKKRLQKAIKMESKLRTQAFKKASRLGEVKVSTDEVYIQKTVCVREVLMDGVL